MPRRGLHALHPHVRKYAWGSNSFLQNWLGLGQADGEPWAELWFGTHPAGAATIEGGAGLDELISQNPLEILGARVAEKFDSLPFLVKLLSAAGPLSLQVHPSAQDVDFEVDQQRLPGERRWVDRGEKVELLIAINRFEVLAGFRELEEISELLEGLNLKIPGDSPIAILRALLTSHREASIAALGRWSPKGSRVDAWVDDLRRKYPQDPMAIAPLVLKYMTLNPGESVLIEPGTPHTYLLGDGVEVMTASDNVLRAGLTPKRVDIEAFLGIVREALPQALGELRTIVVSDRFGVERIMLDGDSTSRTSDGPEILIRCRGSVGPVGSPRSPAFFVESGASYELRGSGELMRIFVP